MRKEKEIRKIETHAQFISWAKEVNAFSSASVTCDLQDIFARSQIEDLKKWFLESEQYDRQILTFSILKNQGEDVAYRFINAYAKKEAMRIIDEFQADLQKDYEKFNAEQNILAKEKKEFEAGLKEKEEAFSRLLNKISQVEDMIHDLKAINSAQLAEITILEDILTIGK